MEPNNRSRARNPRWFTRFYPTLELLEDRLVLSGMLDISGSSSVLAGQAYTLHIESDFDATITIDWGDGTYDFVSSQPSADYFHTYYDAPQGFLIDASSESAFASDTLLVNVVTPDIAVEASTVVDPGETETLSLANAVEATYTHSPTSVQSLMLVVAIYDENPQAGIAPGVTTLGGRTLIRTPLGPVFEAISYDVRATTPEAGDSVVVRFTIPNGTVLANLVFFDPNTNSYLPVLGSAKYQNSLIRQGNTFTVILDETSFPTIFQLTGTVFTITDAQSLLPNIIALTSDGNQRPPVNNDDVLAGLLDTGGNNPPLGSTVGVVAPSQVNAFQSQNLTSATESPEEAEARRMSRQIMSVLDTAYEQMRYVLMPQLHFVPAPAEDEAQPATQQAIPEEADLPLELQQVMLVAPAEEKTPPHVIMIANESLEPASLMTKKTLACFALAAMPMLPLWERASRRKNAAALRPA